MATVGLSFGSATSGTGFDVASTVSSIIGIEQGIETPRKTQLTTLAAQDTELTTLGTNLSSLSTAVSALTASDGVLSTKEGSSSNTDALTLTAADSTAVAGSHTISITSLASTSSVNSGVIAAATDTLSGSLTIQVGSGTAQTVTVDSGSDTLSTLAEAINTGSYGVTASVVTDTSGSRLSLVSQTSGEAGQLTVSSALTDATANSAVAFTTGQTGANAQLTVDGLAVTTASNTVSGVIAGVTFQLLSAGPNVQVQITNNNAGVETAVQSLVTAYNAVIADLKTQEGNTTSGTAEPLYGDPTVSLIQAQLSSALFGGTSSGSINNLSQLGVTANQDGTLSFSSSTLDGVLNSNFSDVTGYFQSVGSWGQNLSTVLGQIGNTSVTGALALAQQQNATEEAALNVDVTNEDARIAADKTSLTTELNTANEILQSIPAQLNAENELYSSYTGYVASTL